MRRRKRQKGRLLDLDALTSTPGRPAHMKTTALVVVRTLLRSPVETDALLLPHPLTQHLVVDLTAREVDPPKTLLARMDKGAAARTPDTSHELAPVGAESALLTGYRGVKVRVVPVLLLVGPVLGGVAHPVEGVGARGRSGLKDAGHLSYCPLLLVCVRGRFRRGV